MSGDKPIGRPGWTRFPWRRGTLPKCGPAVATDWVLALLLLAVAIGVVATEMNAILKALVAVLAALNLIVAVQEVLLWRRARAAGSKRQL